LRKSTYNHIGRIISNGVGSMINNIPLPEGEGIVKNPIVIDSNNYRDTKRKLYECWR
jgi:hypothetical protein